MKWLLPLILGLANAASDKGPDQIVAAGASFPILAYTDMFRSWSLIQDKTTVSYEGTGSGTGKARIVADIIDFAGSDSKLTAAHYGAVPSLQMMPMLAAAIVLAVNLPGLEEKNTPITLSPDALAGIFSTKILYWDDPIIKKDNPDLTLPHEKVYVLVEPKISGLTTIFSTFLDGSSDLWDYGPFSTWPDGLKAKENYRVIDYQYKGLSSGVFTLPYTITFLPYADTIGLPDWRVASILNTEGMPARPDKQGVMNALAKAEFDEKFNADIFGLAGDVYPLAALTYVVIRKNVTDNSEEGCAHRANVMRVLQWMYTSSTAANAAEKNGFVTLTSAVRDKAISILASLQCGGEFSLKKIISTAKAVDDSSIFSCPHLPSTAPLQLAQGRRWRAPPQGWSCKPELYYELDGIFSESAECNCGCGVIDPDCGYEQTSCDVQTWEPKYKSLTCEGMASEMDLLYCRIESATCQQLPPGLARGHTSPWSCIPDVYNELSDPGTKRNDCDCNCNGEDPDCFSNYNNEYCPDILEENEDGTMVPKALSWGSGYTCVVNSAGASCVNKDADGKNNPNEVPKKEGVEDEKETGANYPVCPQLPSMAPQELANGHTNTEVPSKWTCDPTKYYELMTGVDTFSCDCGCGVIDPDCGFILKNCQDQTWNPMYTTLTCNGQEHDPDLAYCRLESATCNLLPPGLARGKTSEWKCIPDVYNELSDPGTSLNDCDCNCGGYDPDCNALYESIYCNEAEGNPIPRSVNITCGSVASGDKVVCMEKDSLAVPLQACNFGTSLDTNTGVCNVEGWIVGVGVAAIFLGSMIVSCYMSSNTGRKHDINAYDKKKGMFGEP